MKKNRWFALLTAVVTIISCMSFTVFAENDEDMVKDPPLLIDSFDPEQDISAWSSETDGAELSITEYESKKNTEVGLGVTSAFSPDTENTSITVSKIFDIPLSLKYYKALSFDFLSNQISNNPCEISIEIIGENDTVKYTRKCLAGELQKIRFGISSVGFRNNIKAIKITANVSPDTENHSLSYIIDNLRAEEYMDSVIYDKFMSTDYYTVLGKAEYGDGFIVFDPENDRYLSATLPAFPGNSFDGILIEVEGGSYSGKLQLSYTTSGGMAYVGDKALSINISGEAGGIYYTSAPNISSVARWTLSAENIKEPIKIKRIVPVELGVSKFSSLSGTFTEARLSGGGKSIRVSGTIVSDAVSKHSGARLGLFSLSAGESPDLISNGEKTPVATIPISMKFDFNVPITEEDPLAAAKKYLVAILPDEEDALPIFIGSPVFLSVLSGQDLSSGGKGNNMYDGLIAESTRTVNQMTSGFTVLDVDISRLCTHSGSGQLHKVGNIFRYYDTGYLESLDRKIRTLSRGEIYLRLVTSSSEGSYTHHLLAVTDSESTDLYMVSNFLAARYSGGEAGKIHGFILGYTANRAENIIGANSLSFPDYISAYADTMRIIQCGGSAEQSIKVFASIDDSVYGGIATGESGYYSSVLFTSALSIEMKERGQCEWYLCIDSSSDPLFDSDGVLTPANAPRLSTYLMRINDFSSMGNNRVMYIWHPGDTVGDLTESYLYSVLRFSAVPQIFRFAADTTYTDTHAAISSLWGSDGLNTPYLSHEIIDRLSREGVDLNNAVSEVSRLRRVVTQGTVLPSLPSAVLGSYEYFDFTELYGSGGFTPSDSGVSISSESSMGKRRMKTAFSVNNTNAGILYRFKFPEDMSVSSYISVDLEIPENEGEKTVTVIIGEETSSIEFSATVSGRREIICDLTDYAKNSSVKYIEIIVSDVTDGLAVYTYSITGHSIYYTDNSLESVILKNRELSDTADPTEDALTRTYLTVAIVVLTVFTIAIVLVLSRKNQPKES